MVDKKILELDARTPDGTEYFPVATSGANWKILLDDVMSMSSGARTQLTGDMTFYVRSDGNNSNDGLANNSGSAFLTLDGAYAAIAQNYDFNGFSVTLINGNSATYTTGMHINGQGGKLAWVGGGEFHLDLNGGAIADNNSFGSCLDVSQYLTGLLEIDNGSISQTNNGWGITHGGSGLIDVGDTVGLNVGAISREAFSVFPTAGGGASIAINTDFTVSGNMRTLFSASKLGNITCAGPTITFSGTPNFSDAVVFGDQGGQIFLNASTFVGSATGVRFILRNGSLLEATNNQDTFPGSLHGITGGGSRYTFAFGALSVNYVDAIVIFGGGI